MTREPEDTMPEGGDDLIAAEYVLGVLSESERSAAAARIENERAFAQLVDEWARRLSPLDDAYDEVAPSASVWKSVDARLFASPLAKPAGFWQNLNLWRGLAFAAMALAAVAIAPDLRQAPPQPAAPIVASLQADTGEVRFVALYQPGSDELRISRVKADKGADRDFELWLLDDGGKPLSMGVISGDESVRLKVKPELVARINAGDTFAVSVEPVGGSPTGDPTGPVIAAGVSKNI